MRIFRSAGLAAGALALMLTGITAGSGPSLASGSATSPWTQTDYNGALSQANPNEQILTPVTVQSVEHLWDAPAPPSPPQGYCPAAGVSSPLLAGTDTYAITDYTVSKYNGQGHLIWQVEPDTGLGTTYFSIDLTHGLLLVGGATCTSASMPVGLIWAYNAATGALVWSQQEQSGFGNMVVAGSDLVVDGSNSAGQQVEALNVSTGATLWTQSNECGYGGNVLVVHNRVIVPWCNDTTQATGLSAFLLSSGAPAWSFTGSWAAVRGDQSTQAGTHLLVKVPGGAVKDVNPVTGTVRYRFAKAVNVLAIDQSQVYATCGDQQLCAYALDSGQLAWTQFLPLLASSQSQVSAVEANGVLYLNSGQLLSTSTGDVITILWSGYSGLQASSLAVGQGRIAVVTDPRVLDMYGLPPGA